MNFKQAIDGTINGGAVYTDDIQFLTNMMGEKISHQLKAAGFRKTGGTKSHRWHNPDYQPQTALDNRINDLLPRRNVSYAL